MTLSRLQGFNWRLAAIEKPWNRLRPARSHSHEGSDPVAPPSGALLLSIPAMDCAVEEGRIRTVLVGFGSVRRLGFDLGGRTLSIDAPEAEWPALEAAIATAGFKFARLTAPRPVGDVDADRRREVVRLAGALVAATVAELLGELAPAAMAWKAAGMALAVVAIALAGWGVLRKGLSSLGRIRLDVSAPSAVFASATMWMALFADMGASLLVVFNGLRLLRSRP